MDSIAGTARGSYHCHLEKSELATLITAWGSSTSRVYVCLLQKAQFCWSKLDVTIPIQLTGLLAQLKPLAVERSLAIDATVGVCSKVVSLSLQQIGG